MSDYDVIIASPGKNFDIEYIRSLTNTIEELNKLSIKWKWVTDTHYHASEARTNIVKALDGISYNKLFFIDPNLSWSVKNFMALYNSEKDIISGVYIEPNGDLSVSINGTHWFTPQEIFNIESVSEAEFTTLGFTAIKSGIVESIPYAFASYWLDTRLEFIYSGFVYREDIAFCVRAKDKHGLKIYFDPEVRPANNQVTQFRL